jgi:hypothetical protein
MHQELIDEMQSLRHVLGSLVLELRLAREGSARQAPFVQEDLAEPGEMLPWPEGGFGTADRWWNLWGLFGEVQGTRREHAAPTKPVRQTCPSGTRHQG